MKSKQSDKASLEAELIRLNALVRERRKQLARLEKCPNKDCPCRFVWREVVEERLAGQMGKIRQQLLPNPRPVSAPKRKARNSK